MIRNIIFDIGNVLLTFEPKKFLLKFTKNITQIENFIQNVTSSEIWLKLDRGVISVEHAKNLFLSNNPEQEELLKLFFENWFEIFEPIQRNIEILKDLKFNG